MADYKKTLYNIAINGQGYLFSGIPLQPARVMSGTKLYGTYPTEIDLEYQDSSQFIPWAQTDFSGGFQDEKWKDNAKFKKGTGLEYIAKYGELTLLNNKTATVKDFGAGYTFGASCIYNKLLLIGTQHATLATLGHLSSADSWTSLTTGWADIIKVHSMDESSGKVYIALERDSGAEKCLQSWDSANFADATGDADDTTIWRMVKRIETRLYAANYNSAANGDRLLYSDNGGTNWNAIITATGKNRTITQGVDNLGTLYFLIEDFPRCELWWCNDIITTQIYRWENLTNPKITAWLGKVFIEGKQNGKLMRFEWNGATLKTIFEEKIDSLDLDTSPSVVYKNNLYSYGLVYDGLFHFPSHILKYTANKIYPFVIFGGTSSQVPYFYGLDSTSLKITKLNTAAYLTTGNVITGIYNANKSAVDKLWHSVTLSYKILIAGQSIKVEYSSDDEANWTEIGTASTAAGITEKTFYFANNTISKRIQIRVTLAGGGSNTPTLYDFIVRFLPLSDGKFEWTFRLNCSDNMTLLDGKTKEEKMSGELRNILRMARFNNQIVELQDIDFAETLINDGTGITADDTTITVDSTAAFTEQGRIKIEQEEILYTGKTAVAFTGCTRGQRGTKAATHADDVRVHNAYNVIIGDLSESNPVAPVPKVYESTVLIPLKEV